MKSHVHAELIKQWADGAEVEYKDFANGTWKKVDHPAWIPEAIYRIKDPYAELNAAAADPTKQVSNPATGLAWKDCGSYKWVWSEPPESYAIRDKPLKVKMWQWIVKRSDGSLFSTIDFYEQEPDMAGVYKPALWTEIEVDL